MELENKEQMIPANIALEFTKTVDKSNQRHMIVTIALVIMVIVMCWCYFKTDYGYGANEITNTNTNTIGADE